MNIKNQRKTTKRDRNQEIVRLYNSTKYTEEEIGKRFGITRQRVSQIIRRAGLDGNRMKKVRAREARIVLVCKHCEREFRVPPSRTNKVYCGDTCFRKARRQFSNEDLRNHLQQIYQEHGKLTTPLIRENKPPSLRTIIERVGNIEKIQRFAGVYK